MGRPLRSPSAIAVSALVFGSMASPFFYFGRRLGASYTAEFLIFALPLLVFCVVLLLLVLTKERSIERRLRRRLGKAFVPLFYLSSVGAFLLTWAILAVVANFGLLSAIEYYYYLTAVFGMCAAAALVIVLVAPASRLELAVQLRMSKPGAARRKWRILVYGILIALLLLSSAAIYHKLAQDAAILEHMGLHIRPAIHLWRRADEHDMMGSKRLC